VFLNTDVYIVVIIDSCREFQRVDVFRRISYLCSLHLQ